MNIGVVGNVPVVVVVVVGTQSRKSVGPWDGMSLSFMHISVVFDACDGYVSVPEYSTIQ